MSNMPQEPVTSVKCLIRYKSQIIQTDNGFEFTYPKDYNRIHPFNRFCESIGIEQKPIRPRTPWHNGKVERSHRNDQERFCNFLNFYSFKDLKEQMYRYMRRSNRIPMAVLGWVSPIETFTTRGIASVSNTLSLTLVKAIQLNHATFFFFYNFGLTSLTNVQGNSHFSYIFIIHAINFN